jgi:hypothetical protein
MLQPTSRDDLGNKESTTKFNLNEPNNLLHVGACEGKRQGYEKIELIGVPVSSSVAVQIPR